MTSLAISTKFEQENFDYDVCEAVTVNALYEQVKSAQLQINTQGDNIAHVELNSSTVVITVNTCQYTAPIPMTYGLSAPGMRKALAHIHQFVTVSPSSSAKEGTLLGVKH